MYSVHLLLLAALRRGPFPCLGQKSRRHLSAQIDPLFGTWFSVWNCGRRIMLRTEVQYMILAEINLGYYFTNTALCVHEIHVAYKFGHTEPRTKLVFVL
jgi:hypothetical protein